MFFLISHLMIGKYYPNFFTQFAIGCVLYIIAFFILYDILTSNFYDEYKYYIFTIIAIDLSYLFYKAKYSVDNEKKINSDVSIPEENKLEQNTTDLITGTANSISLSSDINDYRITHDISSSDTNNSLFSSDNELFLGTHDKSDKINSIDKQTKSSKILLKKEPSSVSYHSDTIGSDKINASLTTISL